MKAVNVTELRQHLPDYLKQVQQGEEIAITLHDKTCPPCRITMKVNTKLR
ncbi:MAG: type II toxin-antitoxin system prevent-host-death family antitoxin [Methylobacter sp.]|nr:type II toxin-antitoxin system prevent-host-death family antitoxin [Methylobacter sp.]